MNDDEFNDADLYGDDDYGMDDDTFDDTDMTKALAQADLLTKNIQECITPRSAGVTKSNVVAHTTSPSSCSPRTPRSRRASSSSITGAETIVTYRKGRAIEAMGLDIAHTKLGKTFSDQVTSASRKKGTNTFSRVRHISTCMNLNFKVSLVCEPIESNRDSVETQITTKARSNVFKR